MPKPGLGSPASKPAIAPGSPRSGAGPRHTISHTSVVARDGPRQIQARQRRLRPQCWGRANAASCWAGVRQGPRGSVIVRSGGQEQSSELAVQLPTEGRTRSDRPRPPCRPNVRRRVSKTGGATEEHTPRRMRWPFARRHSEGRRLNWIQGRILAGRPSDGMRAF